jgi:dihydroflavonol-4-reductase
LHAFPDEVGRIQHFLERDATLATLRPRPRKGSPVRILVTGAGGFLGSHVARVLLGRGHQVRVLVRPSRPNKALEGLDVERAEGDLLDEPSLVRACRDSEGLIHCAARTGYWSRQDDEQRAINVEGTSALLRSAHRAKIGRIVHVSSIATIGCSKDGRVLDETHVWMPRSLRINYVTTKHESEERAFAAAWAGMDVVVVNPCMLMGPRFDGRPRSGLVNGIANRTTRWIPPGGTSVVDVADAAEGCVLAFERGAKGQRYILGGHNQTWREMHERIARAAGVPAPKRSVPLFAARTLELGARVLDVAHLSRPPWTPEILRTWGLFGFVDSAKAKTQIGYTFRPLDETIRRALG